MPAYLLHSLWLVNSGFHLWIEQVKGHKVVTVDRVPEGTFPPAVERMIRGNRQFYVNEVTLKTPKGRDVGLKIPTISARPIEFLESLAFLEGDSVAATRAQRESIAPDLYWLVRMCAGLRRFVLAGRFSFTLKLDDDGNWYLQWQLGNGLQERGWAAEMIAAAPGVLPRNCPSFDNIADDMTHWIMLHLLEELRTEERQHPWHDFPWSLISGSPVRRGNANLKVAIDTWRESTTAPDVNLVFIVEEPIDPQENALPGDAADEGGVASEGGVAKEGGAPGSVDNLIWKVRVRVRSGTDTPRPVRTEEYDRATLEKLLQLFEIATRNANDLRRPGTGGYDNEVDTTSNDGRLTAPFIPAPINSPEDGEWDAELTTEQMMKFAYIDAKLLVISGFTVLMPKSWSAGPTKARLRATDPAEGATKRHLGMEQLVNYQWELSVGDTTLTQEEMQDLIHSRSGLINLRGKWVKADTHALREIGFYMDGLKSKSMKHRRAELERAAREVEVARAEGDPNWKMLERQLETRREQFNNDFRDNNGGQGDGLFGEVTMAELRQLALESMVEEPVEFTGSTWHTALLGGTETPAPDRVDIPETVHATLREYQRRGVDWLYWMSRNGLGAVLADDMGLGKTLQLLAAIEVERSRGEAEGPTLVVAPTSVVGNWAKEAARFVPGMTVLVHHGSGRKSGDELIAAATAADLVITSYGVVSRDFKALGQVPWDRVALDEAQAIKNSATQSSKAVRSLPSRHRVALTGTPVENRLSELRSILDFVNPGILGSASFFRNHFAKPIESSEDEIVTERLRQLTAPFVMRRIKTDTNIIDDLPDKSEEILVVRQTDEQAALYSALVDSIKTQLEEREGISRRGLVLASITRFKQICNHPAHFLGDGSPVVVKGKHRSGKVEELVRLIKEAIRTDQRMLVFTQYKAFGDILQPYLTDLFDEEVPFLHGGLSKAKRDQMVEDYQKPDGARVMILSLKAGGTGLNLTAASMVVHMDRWWNPAVENQATDRAFRIGQAKNVQVYKMVTKGTMEESIQDILDGKMQLAGAIVTEGEGWITELSPDQFEALMNHREVD